MPIDYNKLESLLEDASNTFHLYRNTYWNLWGFKNDSPSSSRGNIQCYTRQNRHTTDNPVRIYDTHKEKEVSAHGYFEKESMQQRLSLLSKDILQKIRKVRAFDSDLTAVKVDFFISKKSPKILLSIDGFRVTDNPMVLKNVISSLRSAETQLERSPFKGPMIEWTVDQHVVTAPNPAEALYKYGILKRTTFSFDGKSLIPQIAKLVDPDEVEKSFQELLGAFAENENP
jgi:hypothetical protein